MNGFLLRGVAIAGALSLVAVGCSSSHHADQASTTTGVSTTVPPTTVPRSGTTVPRRPTTTAKGTPVTKPDGTPVTEPGGTPVTTPATPASVPTAPTTVPAPPTTHVAGATTRWKLALDYRSNPSANPFPSYDGGPRVWSLRESTSRQRDGNYPLLPKYSAPFGSAGIDGWHGTSGSCISLPAVGVNTVGGSVPLCSATIPSDVAFAIPSSTRMAVVAWTSPFTGTATISNDGVADLDGTCGDGISYYVALGTKQLTNITLTNHNSYSVPQTNVQIKQGQSLYFIVDPGPKGDAGCDATQLALTIDQVG